MLREEVEVPDAERSAANGAVEDDTQPARGEAVELVLLHLALFLYGASVFVYVSPIEAAWKKWNIFGVI